MGAMGARRGGHATAGCCIRSLSHHFITCRRTTRRAVATASCQFANLLPRTCHGGAPCLSLGCTTIPARLYALSSISGAGLSTCTPGRRPSISSTTGSGLSTTAGLCAISNAGLSWLSRLCASCARCARICPVSYVSCVPWLQWLSSLLASTLTFLGGLASVVILALFLIGTSINSSSRTIHPDQYLSALLTFTAFAIAGIFGGGFSIYHSIRALLRKRSANFALPWFWVFLILYLIVVGIGYALYANKQEVASPALTVFLIILAAIFPAFALTALGVRRLRFPEWTTTWRRFTLALTSGATLGIGLALILELCFLFLLVRGPDAANFQKCINNPNQSGCGSFTTFNLIFLIVAVVGPIVEETVKPLAVAFYIGRMRSASEAFVLGMAAGIGFAMVETVGYIGSGYHDWLAVALERTGAGLLPGFGAAMVALGWYYLVHAKERRLLKAFGCWAYAVFQHFVWNATAVLSLLPGPAGSTLNSWHLNLGFVTLPFVEILNIIEAILIFVFFIYMTGRLRRRVPPPPASQERQLQPGEPQMASRA